MDARATTKQNVIILIFHDLFRLKYAVTIPTIKLWPANNK